MEAACAEDGALEARLRCAVERGALELHLQPYVELPSGRPRGVEALARWWDGARGWVAPSRFVPLAERTGLVVPMGRHLLRQACSLAASWRAQGDPEVDVSVNVSPLQLAEPGLVDDVVEALARAGLPGRALCLEVTETAVLHDVGSAAEQLAAVRSLGVRVALDDFGTGSSSLVLLRRLPVDVLKVDKSFVDRVHQDPRDAVLVRLLVDAAHAIGVSVCAEGVESLAQARQLVALGVDAAQGWAFAPARPPREGGLLGPEHRPSVAVDMAVRPLLELGSSAELTGVVDADGVVSYVSPGVVESLGRPASDLVGRRAAELLHPDDLSRLGGALADGGGRVVVRARRADGGWAAWRVQGRSAAGTGTQLWVGYDVSREVADARELRARDQLFRLAFEESPVGMAVTDLENRFVLVNRAYADLLGTTPETLRGMFIVEVTHPDDMAADVENLGALATGREVRQRVPKRLVGFDGRVLPVVVMAHLVTDDEGRPAHVLAHVEAQR